VLILHPQAQDSNGSRSGTGHPYSLPKAYSVTPRQIPRNAWR
jgi:hypothetical protein